MPKNCRKVWLPQHLSRRPFEKIDKVKRQTQGANLRINEAWKAHSHINRCRVDETVNIKEKLERGLSN